MVSGAGQGRLGVFVHLLSENGGGGGGNSVGGSGGGEVVRLAVMVNGSRGLDGWAGPFLALPVYSTSF